ncbi:MAG: DUF4041 domain-containing protein [Hydrogeniiclostridium sp.]
MAKCNRCGKKGLFLRVNAEGLCEACAQELLSAMKAAMTPEQREFVNLQDELFHLHKQKEETSSQLFSLQNEIRELEQTLSQKKSLLIQMDEEILMQEFGLYQPKYDLVNSDAYKTRLDSIRQNQKIMIKNGTAVTGNMSWTVNGSGAQGRKMVKDMQKLLLRAFNSECDDVVEHVKYNNFESAQKRIHSSCESISKLGQIMSISISPSYLQSKMEELQLSFEYRQKKQQEKEEQKELRAQMREEARLQKEIEEERRKLEKEQSHYLNALAKLDKQIETASDEEKTALQEKRCELESHIATLEEAVKQIDYRESNQRAGYVYVISNIGSFGENVYKIGMTRRLNPMERVDELGDASVPFDFDVHAMIFSDDAPKLEAALHRAFENRKLNMVNTRREFFNVTLDEIREVVRQNYDKTAEFVEIPEAEQFRISLKMKQQ